jgi:hypothetical protein
MNELNELTIATTFNPLRLPTGASSTSHCVMQIFYTPFVSDDIFALGGRTADWVTEAAKKLEALGRFRKGWDSYGGRPLKQDAKALTLQTLGWLGNTQLPEPVIALCPAGDVQIEWQDNGKELEIVLGDRNRIEFAKVMPNGDVEEGEAQVNLSGKLRDLTDWLLI